MFSWIYRSNKWGGQGTRSGKGSEPGRTEHIRTRLPQLLAELEISSLLDLPCGDLSWMRHVDLGAVRYLGADIVPELIEINRREFPEREFHVLDICRDPLPEADAVLCRDLLVHLSFHDISLALDNLLGSRAPWLLCTTYPEVGENVDKLTGKHRKLNMCARPFNWPEPMVLMEDGGPDEPPGSGKRLGVWRTSSLPHPRDAAADG